jgi:hypothetical protein
MIKNTTLSLLTNFRESVLFHGDVRKAITKLCDKYSYPISITLEGSFADDKAVCEEIFDLINNPYRQEERVKLYGRGRSVSVGDLVGIDNDETGITAFYAYTPSGWVKI